MPGGYHGAFLDADLTRGSAALRPLDDGVLRRFVGGVGLGAWLLAQEGDPQGDPLAPEAVVVVALSPLVGTPLTTSAKFAVVAKSPLTDRFCDALSSDRFAIELKGCGVDALVLRGVCAEWSVLVVDGADAGRARLEPVPDLAGMSSLAAETVLRARFGDGWRFFGIGPAGENRVRFATCSGDGRHAGRGGLGAVLGSKRLKGILARGGVATPVADRSTVLALAKDLSARSLGAGTAKYRELGTVANLLVFNRLRMLPTRNFTESTFEGAEGLSAEALHALPTVRKHCAACTIGCEHVFARPGHKDATDGVRLEYEGLFALGPLCGIADRDAVIRAAARCDDLGLDVISAGGTIAFAMECRRAGLLPQAPEFGDAEGLLALLDDIAARRGLGAILAEGSRRAAVAIGGGAERFAMHVKGLELPGYEPRSLRAMAVGLAVATRGADHNRSGAYEDDFKAGGGASDAGKGAAAAASEVRSAILDSLILCKFLRGAIPDVAAEGAEMLSAVTGFRIDAAELERVGRRVVAARRLWNAAAGWTRAEDTLPARFLSESGPDAAPEASPEASGHGDIALRRSDLDRMIGDYYRAHRFGSSGDVPPETVRELGLADLFPSSDSRATAKRTE